MSFLGGIPEVKRIPNLNAPNVSILMGRKSKNPPRKRKKRRKGGRQVIIIMPDSEARLSQPRGRWFSLGPSMGVEPDHRCLVLAV